jgi:aryl-alcohol dehydrogenase-like predicted oxidoreductase
MRYRPFGVSGKAVSAVSFLLREAPNMNTPQAWRTMAFSAMESGVNCFEITEGLNVIPLGIGEVLRSVERRLMFLAWRLRGDGRRALTANMIAASVQGGLQKTGALYFDLLTMDEVAYDTLDESAHAYLADLKAAGLCLQIGIVGDGTSVDTCIEAGTFDVLVTPFDLTSDWQARRRVRDAADKNMIIMACNPFPAAQIRAASTAAGKDSFLRGGGLFKSKEPLAGAGTYAFLHKTHGWTAEEVCLGYLLTEPSFSTVQIETFRPETINRYASVADRDLPTGVAAQIEMARFSRDTGDRRRA